MFCLSTQAKSRSFVFGWWFQARSDLKAWFQQEWLGIIDHSYHFSTGLEVLPCKPKQCQEAVCQQKVVLQEGHSQNQCLPLAKRHRVEACSFSMFLTRQYEHIVSHIAVIFRCLLLMMMAGCQVVDPIYPAGKAGNTEWHVRLLQRPLGMGEAPELRKSWKCATTTFGVYSDVQLGLAMYLRVCEKWLWHHFVVATGFSNRLFKESLTIWSDSGNRCDKWWWWMVVCKFWSLCPNDPKSKFSAAHWRAPRAPESAGQALLSPLSPSRAQVIVAILRHSQHSHNLMWCNVMRCNVM